MVLAKRAADKAPEDAMARTTYGWMLARTGDHAAAAAEFEAAVQLAPDDDEARLGRARAWVRTGKVKEAAAEFEALAGKVPDAAQIWADWGAALAKLGDFEGAVAKLDEALKRDPGLVAAHVRKVAALSQAGKCKAAKQANRALSPQRGFDQGQSGRRRGDQGLQGLTRAGNPHPGQRDPGLRDEAALAVPATGAGRPYRERGESLEPRGVDRRGLAQPSSPAMLEGGQVVAEASVQRRADAPARVLIGRGLDRAHELGEPLRTEGVEHPAAPRARLQVDPEIRALTVVRARRQQRRQRPQPIELEQRPTVGVVGAAEDPRPDVGVAEPDR